MDPSKQHFLLIPGVVCAWMIISVHPLWKYLPHAAAATVTLLGVFLLGSAMYWLDQLNRRQGQISMGWILLLFAALSVAFIVLYPRSLKRPLSERSDREDALRIELTAVRQHQYPFDGRTFLHNPPTPLPGAMLLAAPFFAAGHIAWQNVLWLALFFVFSIYFFNYRATALLFLAVFLLFAPANLDDFIAGGDYLTNFFYIAIAVALLVQSLDRTPYAYLPAALFLGVALSSRGIYILVLIPLAALMVQRTSRFRALACLVVIVAAVAGVTLPFFAPHPLMHLAQELNQTSAGKLRFIPALLHPRWTLPLAGGLVSMAAFFIRMNLARIFLFFGIGSFVVLAPFAGTFAVHGVGQRFAYLAICSLAFSLWALRRYEAMPTEMLPAAPVEILQ